MQTLLAEWSTLHSDLHSQDSAVKHENNDRLYEFKEHAPYLDQRVIAKSLFDCIKEHLSLKNTDELNPLNQKFVIAEFFEKGNFHSFSRENRMITLKQGLTLSIDHIINIFSSEKDPSHGFKMMWRLTYNEEYDFISISEKFYLSQIINDKERVRQSLHLLFGQTFTNDNRIIASALSFKHSAQLPNIAMPHRSCTLGDLVRVCGSMEQVLIEFLGCAPEIVHYVSESEFLKRTDLEKFLEHRDDKGKNISPSAEKKMLFSFLERREVALFILNQIFDTYGNLFNDYRNKPIDFILRLRRIVCCHDKHHLKKKDLSKQILHTDVELPDVDKKIPFLLFLEAWKSPNMALFSVFRRILKNVYNVSSANESGLNRAFFLDPRNLENAFTQVFKINPANISQTDVMKLFYDVSHYEKILKAKVTVFENQTVSFGLFCFYWGKTSGSNAEIESMPSVKKRGLLRILETITGQNIGLTSEDQASDMTNILEIEDIVSLFGKNPHFLREMITLLHGAELYQEQVDDVVCHVSRLSFNAPGVKKERYPEDTNQSREVPSPFINSVPHSTQDLLVDFSGRAEPDNYVVVRRYAPTPWRKLVKVSQKGLFKATIPLSVGEQNSFRFFQITSDFSESSFPSESLEIFQKTLVTSSNQALNLIIQKRGLLQDPSIRSLYDRLKELKKLGLKSRVSNDWQRALSLLEQEKKQTFDSDMQSFLDDVYNDISKIGKMKIETLKKSKNLFYFQQEDCFAIRQALEEHKKGILIMNEPGLGKTLETLIAFENIPFTVICPKNLRDVWETQAQYFLQSPDITVLRGTGSQKEAQLQSKHIGRVLVVDREFFRENTIDRVNLVAKHSRVIAVDEADFLQYFDTLQTRAVHSLKPSFLLLLTATPSNHLDRLREIFRFMLPENPIYENRKNYMQHFNLDQKEKNPSAYFDGIKRINSSMYSFSRRTTKSDVFKTYSKGVSLEEQDIGLPEDVWIDPKEMGYFDLTDSQCRDILNLLVNFSNFSKNYQHLYGKKPSANYFSKRMYYRQIINSPSYMGREEGSPKHDKIVQIVDTIEKKSPKKIVIFCRFREEMNTLFAILSRKYKVGRYDGEISQDVWKRDQNGRIIYFKKQGEFFLRDKQGYLIKDHQCGKPIDSLFYEALEFQENPEKLILLVNDRSGGRGQTFTAADYVIYDEQMDNYVQEYQTAGRVNRIDEEHKKYEIRFIKMIALYPKTFLDSLPEIIFDDYFSRGTYDEFLYRDLKVQKIEFRILMQSGIDPTNMINKMEHTAARDFFSLRRGR